MWTTDGNLILPDDARHHRPIDRIRTFCAEVVRWTNPGGTTLNLCQAEDGRVLAAASALPARGSTSSPMTRDGDGVYDSAWVIMGAEESKALGEGIDDDRSRTRRHRQEYVVLHLRYAQPRVVMQGGMLNQPAIDPETGTFFELLEDDFGNEFYETEISRRFSHFSQPIHQIGDSGVSAVLIVKQGILNQGGPADIFLRRLVVPDDIWEDCETDGDATTTERCLPAGYNPYAYENMACDEWVYTDGSNPRYVEGLCLSNMINVSGGTIVSCDNGTSGDDCAAAFPWDGKMTSVQRLPQGDRVGPDRGEPGRPVLGEPLRRLQGPPRLHRRRLHHDDVRLVAQLEGQQRRQRPLQPLRPPLLRRRPDLDHDAG